MALMHAFTGSCTQHGHPEVRVIYDCNLLTPEDLQILIGGVEEAVACGSRLQAGEFFRFGWMALRVGPAGDQILSLFEPDMIHTPVHWVDSVTHSLIHRRVHQEVCASIDGVEKPVFPSHLESCRICDHLGATDGFFISRSEAADGDSGWTLLCEHDTHLGRDRDSLRQVPLYEAVVGFEPRLLPYLALPPGIVMDLSSRPPRIEIDDVQATVLSGSALARSLGLG